jgi:hypothetical protein
MRRREVDLELRAGGDLSGIAQASKDGIGFACEVAIGQAVDADIADARPRLQAIALMGARGLVNPPNIIRELQLRNGGENAGEPTDPAQPLAGFAVGDALDRPTENGADGAENLFGIGQRHAADKMNLMSHWCPPTIGDASNIRERAPAEPHEAPPYSSGR